MMTWVMMMTQGMDTGPSNVGLVSVLVLLSLALVLVVVVVVVLVVVVVAAVLGFS
jgi:hypothetical protein